MEEAELAVGHRAIRPVRGSKVVSPGGVQLTFRAPETKAWVVDRRIFDRALLAEAARSGADVMNASPVTGVLMGANEASLTRLQHRPEALHANLAMSG